MFYKTKHSIMIRILFIISFLFLNFYNVKASHLLGSEITYECLGGGQYLVSLSLYRDCQGINMPTANSVSFSSASCGINGNINVTLQSSADITPLCPSTTSACNGSGTLGIEEYLYQGVVYLPPGACNDWVFGWSSCCRNSAINTLNTPGSQNMYIGAVLDNTVLPVCNSSPVFNNAPSSIVCVNQPVIFNHGVSDADGDSLFFSLGNCLQSATNNVTYSGGFNGTTPLTTSTGVTINSSTGALSFTPTAQQVGVLCVNVREYRNGVLIGQVNRDMQFTVIACSNVPPIASGVNGTPSSVPTNYSTSACANSDFCFTINGSDINTNNVTMSWNNEIPGATFVVTNNGTTSPTAEFCWNPSIADIGQNVFTVNVVDNACPVVGSGTYTFIINVTPSPNTLTVSPNTGVCTGESAILTASSSPTATSYNWSPSATLSASSGASVTASPIINTTYTVQASFPDGCDLQEIVTVNVFPDPIISVTPATINVCSGGAAQLTAVTTLSGQTFQWFNPSMGSLGSGTVSGTSSNILITAPTTPGSYNYTVRVTNPITGCRDERSAVVVVGPPPATNVCNIIYVSTTGTNAAAGTKANPTSLAEGLSRGACNGTILKLAIGTYNIDNALTIPSYVTIEGGYNPGAGWTKTSQAGATTINRTTLNPEGATNAQRLVAFYGNGSAGFRFQDITITTANANQPGMSTYGVHLTACSDYDFVRTQVLPGNAAAGANGTNGAAGGNGANGAVGFNGDVDNDNAENPGGQGGAGCSNTATGQCNAPGKNNGCTGITGATAAIYSRGGSGGSGGGGGNGNRGGGRGG